MDARTVAAEPEAREIDELARRALAEDVGPGDVTSRAVVPAGAVASGVIATRGPGIVAGLPFAERVFRATDPSVVVTRLVAEGAPVGEATPLLMVRGKARAMLAAERTALNLLSRTSGIATLTRRFAEALAGTRCLLLDTRKTTPGLRTLEKYATRIGGATNHRMGLHDAVLVKDNHIAVAGGVGESVRRARSAGLPIEVEVED
ncbi:MAG: carboxylating nicotinate-nucleotide diphosphorylase [Methanobacteriota archaeon]